jgi:ferritin-like metal-binding protein YciE
MQLKSLHALYIEQLQDLYSAETQLIEALPKMAKAATNPDLTKGFQDHLVQTKEHVSRLETILKAHGEKTSGHTCKGMEGLLKEGEEMIKARGDAAVRDAGLIAAAQRVEHYEIAGYGTVCTYAEQMSHTEDLMTLRQTLAEEKATDARLTQVAERSVNLQAE